MHTLITGATGTGKTTLVRRIVHSRLSGGRDCIAYDPMRSIAGSIDDVDAFLDTLQGVRNCSVFIDEADQVLSLSQKENNWILTRGRHYGLDVFLSTQRPQLVSTTARAQCSQFFVFRTCADDRILLERNFACRLPDCESLMIGEYLYGRYSDGGYVVNRGRLF